MTSPIEEISVDCPKCAARYRTFFRASINLELDPEFDDAYVRSVTTGTCPSCGTVAELGALVVGRDGVWRIGRE